MPSLHSVPRLPRGFRCTATHAGVKARGDDLALFASRVPCNAAAVFTRNHFPGAPILLGRELIRTGRLQAVVVNSGVANVGTGEEGLRRARRMGEAAAAELGIAPNLVLVSSTGLIGAPLPIQAIEEGLEGLSGRMVEDPLVGARGIMTTDTVPKAASLSVGDATLTVVAKGAGMVAPNMATMLVYFFTDAALDGPSLDRALRRVVEETFNMLSIDTDTSTSDTCALLANGLAGPVDPGVFHEALRTLAVEAVERIARDGEGATRLLRVRVEGAATAGDARTVTRAIVDSPLIKTMVHGGDPNVGRILMAVGKCIDARIVPAAVDAWIGPHQVVAKGTRATFDPERVRAELSRDPVDLRVSLGVGEYASRGWGCDLSAGYIDENAAYSSS